MLFLRVQHLNMKLINLTRRHALVICFFYIKQDSQAYLYLFLFFTHNSHFQRGEESVGLLLCKFYTSFFCQTSMKKARGSGERRAFRDELKHLRKEVSQREEKATYEVLSRAQVVLSTLTSASLDGPLKHLKDKAFDLVVIDECSQVRV